MLRLGILIAGLAALLSAQDNRAAGQRGVMVPANAPGPKGPTYALLIGVSNYEHVPSLQYADKDAETFAELLAKPLGGGLKPEQILLLTNEKATRAGVDDAVKNFVKPDAAPANLADDPTNVNARHNLALLCSQRGDLARAGQLWQLNLALEPKFMPSWVAYAVSLAARGSAAEAALQFEGIVAVQPDYVTAREALARLYLARNQPADATAQVEASLKLSPANPSLLELRGDAALVKGQKDAARQYWTRSLAVAPGQAARSRLKRKLVLLPYGDVKGDSR